jgi:hypothetical protein
LVDVYSQKTVYEQARPNNVIKQSDVIVGEKKILVVRED